MKLRPVILALREDCDFSRELRTRGFQVLNLPLVKAHSLADLRDFRELLASIERFDGVFITSPVAASVFVDEIAAAGVNKTPVVYVLGERSRSVLGACGIAIDFREAPNTADELLDELDVSRFQGQNVLFVRGDRSLRTIPERLAGVANVEEAVVYETVNVEINDGAVLERLESGEIDWLCFFSPSAVESYVKRGLPRDGVHIATIGDTTAKKAVELGLLVSFVSDRASATAFAEGLARHIESFE